MLILEWLARDDGVVNGPNPVPGFVEFVVKQLGLKEGEVDALTSLLVECSVATLAGGALTVGVIFGMWKLWTYIRNGCSTPDPMARAFSLINEARDGSNVGAFRSQTGRFIPNFCNNVRDSVAPRFSSFFRRGDVEEDWTSEDQSDRNSQDASPRSRHVRDEIEEIEDTRPVIPPVHREEVVIPLLVRREEGRRGRDAPTPPVRAAPTISGDCQVGSVFVAPPAPPIPGTVLDAGAALTADGARGNTPVAAVLSLADQIRDQHNKMLLRSSKKDLKNADLQ